MKILIVDDSKLIHAAVGKMISELGYEVHSVFDGDEAVEFLSNPNQIDVVLLDWNMERMSGIEFLKKNFAEKFYQNHIIMMTTENDPEKIMLALDFGA
ncbi:response regulator, partial [Bacteriovoracaceae bacterium]|nr:response regulator [Bacteriovoracaceae bacterium]